MGCGMTRYLPPWDCAKSPNSIPRPGAVQLLPSQLTIINVASGSSKTLSNMITPFQCLYAITLPLSLYVASTPATRTGWMVTEMGLRVRGIRRRTIAHPSQ